MRYSLILCFPLAALAQTAPVADAFRANTQRVAKRLVLSAEEMPAAKYGYKPTKAQMTFAEVVAHLADENDVICSLVGGMPAPTRTTMAATDSKAHLVGRLRETFAFCDEALVALDDTRLGEALSSGGETATRALIMMNAVAHWSDHYSQAAIYLRLNGLLPPTAQGNPNGA
ncbi:MAG TPA: DinB family protein [Gemmatimonadaceae bacterium]|jgi:hypothetical protein|nr:DinB family protein [Gemmatimonadaceae bacterium]